ncbi:hypothetical protein cyc_07719 [Cyclospora cayetanensis]|uniref:Uncharacterized protein n=1 Tax=Cyclospora cayetanensis TaxID=88456 RepID=A0A1D3DB22_9EIME|nr:hypothetical protein cyc_07719 [Cyclospora cayetanensis]
MTGQISDKGPLEVQQSHSILPEQAYKPFKRRTTESKRLLGEPFRSELQLHGSVGWRELAETRVCSVGKQLVAEPVRSASGRAEAGGAAFFRWRSTAISPNMTLQQRVTLAESQGFLRAKVAAKEQLCSQVIGENQQLLRQLEDSRARQQQTVERLKAEASAVVQHLLADTAVYRDTHENLLRKLELQERQASNDAHRARQAERRTQEAEEKLLVLKRQVAIGKVCGWIARKAEGFGGGSARIHFGLRPSEERRLKDLAGPLNVKPSKGHLLVVERQRTAVLREACVEVTFIDFYHHVEHMFLGFVCPEVSYQFSDDNTAALEQLPEMVTLGVNRMQLVLSETEAVLLEKGFVREVSAKRILQKTEKELRATEKQLGEVKKENERKAEALLKLRLKDHRIKLQDAEVASAKAKAHEINFQLEKLRKERDYLAAWKASHPVYKGYRWEANAGEKSRSVSGSHANGPSSSVIQGFEFSTLKTPQRGDQSKSVRTNFVRSASRASIASSRRVSSVSSVVAPEQKAALLRSERHAARIETGNLSSMAVKSSSTSALSRAVRGVLAIPRSSRVSRQSLEQTGMKLLRRSSIGPSNAEDSRGKQKGLFAGDESLKLARGRSASRLEEGRALSRVSSTGEAHRHLTLTLPSSPRSVVTPTFAHAETNSIVMNGPTAGRAFQSEDPAGVTRLSNFFSTAFSKAAAKEKEVTRQPKEETKIESAADLSLRMGRSGHTASSAGIRRGGSIASTRSLVPGGRRVHIELHDVAAEGTSELENKGNEKDEPLSPKSHIARAQALAFMEGSAPSSTYRDGDHTVSLPRLSRMDSFTSGASVRTLRSPIAAAVASSVHAQDEAVSEGTGLQQQAGRRLAGGNTTVKELVGEAATKGDIPMDSEDVAHASASASKGFRGSSEASLAEGPTAPHVENKQKVEEGSRRPVERSDGSLPTEKKGFSSQRGDDGVAVGGAPLDMEGLLRKYLEGPAMEATEKMHSDTATGKEAVLGDQQAEIDSQGDRDRHEKDIRADKPPQHHGLEKKIVEEGTSLPLFQRNAAAPPSAKAWKTKPLDVASVVAPPEETRAPHMVATESAEQYPVVRMGTRAGPDGGPSRTIAGIRKAPPKLIGKPDSSMPKSVVTQVFSQPPVLKMNSGVEAAASSEAAPVTPARQMEKGKPEVPPLLTLANIPNPDPSAASTARLESPPEVPRGGDSGAPAFGRHTRKRMSAGEVSIGSWAMAAPKISVSSFKLPQQGAPEAAGRQLKLDRVTLPAANDCDRFKRRSSRNAMTASGGIAKGIQKSCYRATRALVSAL